MMSAVDPLSQVTDYAQGFRDRERPLHPTRTVDELRAGFCNDLPTEGTPGAEVIRDLIEAAEPGLVGNTDPNFFAWVMGSSDPVGVAADWLTSIWGQNAAIYQTSPAAAVAEEAAANWLLDLLDLPRDASVGFVTGATMATFVGLAAARSAVLRNAGHDFERLGLQGAPFVTFFCSDDVHVSDLTSIRHLGFGEANIRLLPSDTEGLVAPETLAKAMNEVSGPKIVIAQAGHINSGGFENFRAFAEITRCHQAWLHVDGAFGLWARTLPEKQHLTDGLELADSWSVDGHKWLQIPYDSGFAIVRDAEAHRRAMAIRASYLNEAPEDGRNPSSYCPGLSRRARGFTTWAVLKSLGRDGVCEIVRRHCTGAKRLADEISKTPGIKVLNQVDLNQIVVASTESDPDNHIARIANFLNEDARFFVRTADWKGRSVLRLSVISRETDDTHISALAEAFRQCM